MNEERKKHIEKVVYAKCIKRTVWILWVLSVLFLLIHTYILLFVGCENTLIDDVCYIFTMIAFLLVFWLNDPPKMVHRSTVRGLSSSLYLPPLHLTVYSLFAGSFQQVCDYPTTSF